VVGVVSRFIKKGNYYKKKMWGTRRGGALKFKGT